MPWYCPCSFLTIALWSYIRSAFLFNRYNAMHALSKKQQCRSERKSSVSVYVWTQGLSVCLSVWNLFHGS
jgi:hypothetical protein